MARFDTADVRRYYDRNTASFVAFGQGGDVGAIHRAVWGRGVETREEAFHYVEDLLALVVKSQIPNPKSQTKPSNPESQLHVVDLGCGVGASLCYLAERLPIRGTGVTLSPVQARLGQQRAREVGLGDRVTCLEGDYNALPAGLGPADVAYAIESFVHGPDPARFFAQAAALLRPGGVLAICDDFKRPTADRAASRVFEQFCRGWHVNTLIEPRELRALASAAGFEHESTTDLSPCLELRRARDRVIDGLVAIAGWLPLERTRFGHLIGGSALQKGLARGWIGYDLAVFRRGS